MTRQVEGGEVIKRSKGLCTVQKIIISRDCGKSKSYFKAILRQTPVGLDPLFRQILQDVDTEGREDAVKLLQWALFSQASDAGRATACSSISQ